MKKGAKLWQGLAILVGLYMCVALGRSLWQLYRAGGRVEEARQELGNLKLENEQLQIKLVEVETDGFVEGQARDKLNLQRTGEIVVVLPQMKEREGEDQGTEELRDVPNWQKWAGLFK